MPRPARFYVFTYYDYGDNVPKLGEHVRYVCWQPEICPETKRPHLQGYAEFTKPVRIPQAQKELDIGKSYMHEKLKDSTREQARDYCRKQESANGPWVEIGTWIGGQGHRSDLDGLAEAIREGKTLYEIVDQHTVAFIRSYRGVERAMEILRPPPSRRACRVYILYGVTGTGKSSAIAKVYPDCYWFPKPQNGHCYALAYTGQRVAVFDDFYSWIPLDFMLRICDKNPLVVNICGGSASFLADTIIITSNQNPKYWWSGMRGRRDIAREELETVPSFARRITHSVEIFDDEWKYDVSYGNLLTWSLEQ